MCLIPDQIALPANDRCIHRSIFIFKKKKKNQNVDINESFIEWKWNCITIFTNIAAIFSHLLWRIAIIILLYFSRIFPSVLCQHVIIYILSYSIALYYIKLMCGLLPCTPFPFVIVVDSQRPFEHWLDGVKRNTFAIWNSEHARDVEILVALYCYLHKVCLEIQKFSKLGLFMSHFWFYFISCRYYNFTFK